MGGLRDPRLQPRLALKNGGPGFADRLHCGEILLGCRHHRKCRRVVKTVQQRAGNRAGADIVKQQPIHAVTDDCGTMP